MTYKESYDLYMKNWTIARPKSVNTKQNSFLAQESLLLGDLEQCAYYQLLSLCKTVRSVNKVRRELCLAQKMAQLYYDISPQFRVSRVENYLKSRPLLALQILILHLAKERYNG
jgi:hypothetical protein